MDFSWLRSVFKVEEMRDKMMREQESPIKELIAIVDDLLEEAENRWKEQSNGDDEIEESYYRGGRDYLRDVKAFIVKLGLDKE